jgi:hypothetical protein
VAGFQDHRYLIMLLREGRDGWFNSFLIHFGVMISDHFVDFAYSFLGNIDH